MDTEREKKDFLAFILDCEADYPNDDYPNAPTDSGKRLTEQFIKTTSGDDLKKFFYEEDNCLNKKYNNIKEDRIGEIFKAKKKWVELTPEGCGRPPCHGPKRGY